MAKREAVRSPMTESIGSGAKPGRSERMSVRSDWEPNRGRKVDQGKAGISTINVPTKRT